MLELSKILLPVDFSEHGKDAARCAGALARRFGAQLIPLHVQQIYAPDIRDTHGPIDTGWIATLENRLQHELDSYQELEWSGLNVKGTVITGDPACQIAEYAKRGKVNLIVMPTHGYGRFRRFLLGSVTAKVLHDVSCPVWTGVHLRDR